MNNFEKNTKPTPEEAPNVTEKNEFSPKVDENFFEKIHIKDVLAEDQITELTQRINILDNLEKDKTHLVERAGSLKARLKKLKELKKNLNNLISLLETDMNLASHLKKFLSNDYENADIFKKIEKEDPIKKGLGLTQKIIYLENELEEKY